MQRNIETFGQNAHSVPGGEYSAGEAVGDSVEILLAFKKELYNVIFR